MRVYEKLTERTMWNVMFPDLIFHLFLLRCVTRVLDCIAIGFNNLDWRQSCRAAYWVD